MIVTRNEVLAFVNLFAFRARLPKDVRHSMLDALSNPNVVRVAVGAFDRVNSSGVGCCYCPLSLGIAFRRLSQLRACDSPLAYDYAMSMDEFYGLFDDRYAGEQILELVG